MTPASRSSADLSLPFDGGLWRGLLVYLRRLRSYGAVLAGNLLGLLIVYIAVSFPSATGVAVVALCAAYSLRSMPRFMSDLYTRHSARLDRRANLPRSSTDDLPDDFVAAYHSRILMTEEGRVLVDMLYADARKKLEEEERRVRARIAAEVSEANARIRREAEQLEMRARTTQQSLAEIGARLDLFRRLHETGVLPVWSRTGEMTIVT